MEKGNVRKFRKEEDCVRRVMGGEEKGRKGRSEGE